MLQLSQDSFIQTPTGLYLPTIRPYQNIFSQCFTAEGDLRWEDLSHNGVCNLGFNLMLDSTFRSASITTYSSWYMGLISNSGYSGLSATDVMSSHSGWSEDSSHFSGSNRPAWTPGAASSKTITNSSTVNFAINTDNTVIKGIFVCTDNTLGGTTGLLFASGLFSSDQTLFNGDTLKIQYSVVLS